MPPSDHHPMTIALAKACVIVDHLQNTLAARHVEAHMTAETMEERLSARLRAFERDGLAFDAAHNARANAPQEQVDYLHEPPGYHGEEDERDEDSQP